MLLRRKRKEHACFLISHIKLHGKLHGNYTGIKASGNYITLHGRTLVRRRWRNWRRLLLLLLCSGGGEEHACFLKFSLKINYMENYTDIYTEIKSPADCTLHYTEWSKKARTLVRRKWRNWRRLLRRRRGTRFLCFFSFFFLSMRGCSDN